jgi:hypothetical protein
MQYMVCPSSTRMPIFNYGNGRTYHLLVLSLLCMKVMHRHVLIILGGDFSIYATEIFSPPNKTSCFSWNTIIVVYWIICLLTAEEFNMPFTKVKNAAKLKSTTIWYIICSRTAGIWCYVSLCFLPCQTKIQRFDTAIHHQKWKFCHASKITGA